MNVLSGCFKAKATEINKKGTKGDKGRKDL